MIFETQDLYDLRFGILIVLWILGQVWYLIGSIPDLCTLTYFSSKNFKRSSEYYQETPHIHCRLTHSHMRKSHGPKTSGRHI